MEQSEKIKKIKNYMNRFYKFRKFLIAYGIKWKIEKIPTNVKIKENALKWKKQYGQF